MKGRIALFQREAGEGNKPVLSGDIELDTGEKLRVSLWPATSDKGLEYLRGSVEPPFSQETTPNKNWIQPAPEGSTENAAPSNFDDDIPF